MENVKKSFKSLKWYEWLMIAVMAFIATRAMVLAFTNPSVGGNPPWLTVINFVSALCGIICIFFCAKAHVSNFAFGLVNTVVYAVYLWYWKIYGTFFLEMLFYLPMNIWSWYVWAHHRDEVEPARTKAKKLTLWQNIGVVAFVVATTLVVHLVLVKVGGNVAWLDAITVAIGLVATILELCRISEQYVWWIITDIVAVAMYVVQFDPVYLTKKSIYLIMAIIGLYNWLKLNKENNPNNE